MMGNSTPAAFDGRLVDAEVGRRDKIARVFIGVAGLALCFTGIGALAGVPIVLYALFAGVRKKDRGMYVGHCPACGTEIAVGKNVSGFDCPSCRSRILLRDQQFSHFDRRAEAV